MAKEITTKDAIAEAKTDIAAGRVDRVRHHVTNLIVASDAKKARLASIAKSIETEVAALETEINRFSKMTVDEAYAEIVLPQSQTYSWSGVVGSTGSCSNPSNFSVA